MDTKKTEEYLKLDPKVPIKLGGSDYTLEMNLYAVLGIQKDTQYNILEKGLQSEITRDPAIMASMLYWCLKTNHESITPEQVQKMMSYKHMPYILETLVTCFEYFVPILKKGPESSEGVTEVENPLKSPLAG